SASLMPRGTIVVPAASAFRDAQEPTFAVGDAEEPVLAPAVRAGAHGHGAGSSSRSLHPSSPRAPCPTAARRGTGPSASSCARGVRPPRDGVVPRRRVGGRSGGYCSISVRAPNLAVPALLDDRRARAERVAAEAMAHHGDGAGPLL